MPGKLILVALFAFATCFGTTPVLSQDESPQELYESALLAIKDKDYPLAETKLRQLIALSLHYQEPSGCSPWYQLGRVLELQNKKMDAIRILEQGLDSLKAIGRNDWFLNFELACLYSEFDFKGEPTITRLAYDVFKYSTPKLQPELWQRILNETGFLFKEEERKRFEQMVSEEDARAGLELLRFFRREDPSPITEENEYLVTFFKRSLEARQRFGSDRCASGFDARGELYVRYGKPYSIISDRSGIQGPVGYKVYPYEFWFYKHISKELYYTFVRPNGKSYFVLADGPESVFSTAYKGRTTFGSEARTTWSDRFHTDPTFGEEAISLRENLYLTLAGQHEKFRDRFNELNERESSEAKLSYANSMFPHADHDHIVLRETIAPTVIYKVGEKSKDLPISMSLSRFQGLNGKVRTEISYSIPYRELYFYQTDNGYQAEVHGQIAIFNENYELVAGDFIQEQCEAPTKADASRGMCINQWNYTLYPGHYDLFVSLEDTIGRRFGVINTSFKIDAFSRDSLALSDIELASHIEESKEVSRFVKRGYLVVPLPSLSVSRDNLAYLYFEIYNLSLDESGNTNYQIGYRLSSTESPGRGFLGIFATKGSDESITLSDSRTGTLRNQVEHIALDLRRFEPGEANLEVIVADLNAKQEIASEVKIRLVD